MCVLSTNHTWIHQFHCMCVLFHKPHGSTNGIAYVFFSQTTYGSTNVFACVFFSTNHMDQPMSLHVCSFHKTHMDQPMSLHVCPFPQTTWINKFHCMCVLFTKHT